jgi:hypothetical protein
MGKRLFNVIAIILLSITCVVLIDAFLNVAVESITATELGAKQGNNIREFLIKVGQTFRKE